MAKIINASINLLKIDKSKIVEKDKNGQPFKNGGKFLNIQISLNDEPDNYGNDCSISIGQTKEEREAKVERIYLGNGKVTWSSDTPLQGVNKPLEAKPMTNFEEEDSLPF